MFLEIKGKPWIHLELGQLYLFGKQMSGDKRKSNNFIELEEEEDVSQRQCVIETNHSAEAFVFDLFSLKGTLLNNKILNCLEKTLLNNGDILKFGKNEIKYVYDEHELDSSGFLEANKNKSGAMSSSPDSTSQRETSTNFLVPSIPLKKLDVSSCSLSSNNRRSDSFTIPETQFFQPNNSLNGSNLSITESVLDDNDGKIKFNFGNLDIFEGDDDLCIPETQEVLEAAGISTNRRSYLLSEVRNESKDESIAEEVSSKLSVDGSQFRICTQDYMEGFGEEESAAHLHSQIIPLIKHQTVNFNSTKSSNKNSTSQSIVLQEEKDISALKRSNETVGQETREIRADCPTPDIFDFDGFDEENKKQQTTKENENVDISSTEKGHNLLDEDEEDFLPTQVLLPGPLITKVVENKSLNELEKPCLETENDGFITLSDKENRCPVSLETRADLPPTQLFEVHGAKTQTSISCRKSISSAINPNPSPTIENNSTSFLNIAADADDELLTQAFLQPYSRPITSNGSPSKFLPDKCLNSTLLDDKVMAKNPGTFFGEMEKTPSKQTSSATVFKMPDKDFSVVKKTSSATSATSENDLDLLMCTPKLIKDNIFLGRTEELKKNIMAVKNRNLIDDESEEEDEDGDDESDLVELINVPKNFLDFDKLLPHLNTKLDRTKRGEANKSTKEAQKIYKFNIPFGKEQDEKQSNASVSKSSLLSRDERHAARDKEKEILERRGRTKTRDGKSHSPNKHIDVSSRNEKEKKSKERTNKKKSSKNKKESNDPKQNQVEPSRTIENVKEKTISKEQTTMHDYRNNRKSGNSQNGSNPDKSATTPKIIQDKETNKLVKNTRKRHASSHETEKKQESELGKKVHETPARRVTRSKSKLIEPPPTAEEGDDLDSIVTQPIAKFAEDRTKHEQNISQDSQTSNKSLRNKNKTEHTVSSHVNTVKTYDRKRKADVSSDAVPVKVQRKPLGSTHSPESLTKSSVSISMTMVDQELFKTLFKNSKGLWNIATNCADSDILVMDKAYRTFKFLFAMARGIPIVTSEYLKKLNESKSIKEVRITEYLFKDKEFEKKYNFSLVKSLQAAKKIKIFEGYEFLTTASILPNPQEIKAIVEASGGYVHDKSPPNPEENQKLYLVTVKEDKKEWHKYRRLNKNIIIVSTEAIMSTVMSQNNQLNRYRLA